jgi:KUP system potassium uptake protein
MTEEASPAAPDPSQGKPGAPAPAGASGAGPDPAGPPAHGDPAHLNKRFWTLALASVGVVFGDIGTSPLYAFKESIHHIGERGAPATPVEIYSVISLMLWSLIFVVLVKYVLFLTRFDNRGEGGMLSLVTLLQREIGRRTPLLFVLALCGAALFFGDALLTPAISVLSAVEGLRAVPALAEQMDPYIIPIAIVIIIGLFVLQSRGTAHIGALFGPVCTVWFLTLGALGLYQIVQNPAILQAASPHYAVDFLLTHSVLGFVVLGSVVLTVTGAEALYADMGHFGRKPIAAMWIFLVLPCLVLNYFGQGALVLAAPDAAANPLFMLAPEAWRLPLVVLATMATVIACQAVISGAFSLTQQAMQLGLLPRLRVVNTSSEHQGQIYLPQINYMLLVGVVLLVLLFRSSSNLASAYGVAVIATMMISSILCFLAVRRIWKKSLALSVAIVTPFLLIEGVFFASSLLKIPSGGYVPLIIGGMIILLMWTWVRGSKFLMQRTVSDETVEALLLGDKAAICADGDAPKRIRGTAVFLTQTPDSVPSALIHNLKHNKVLHERNVMLTLRTADTPRVSEEDKVEVETVGADLFKVTMRFGYMETPHVLKGIALLRRKGLNIDTRTTSFFVSRHTLLANARIGMPLWQDHIFIFLHRNAVRASEFFHIPTSRVVELGSQMMV